MKDAGWTPEWGRSPGERNGNPLQCSYLGNPKDTWAWRATVHGVAHRHDWVHACTQTHIPTGVRWHGIGVSIYQINSQIISEIEHLFMHLLAICISSLEKWLFRSFSVFIWIYFWLLSYMSSSYILDINPLSDWRSTSIFSHSVGCLFILLIASFVTEAF